MSMRVCEPRRLRLARELVGLSQNQLATEVGLSAAAISQFESGAARPSAFTISVLSSALNVPAQFFTEPVLETHEGFFRSLRRTAMVERRRARAVGHIAHDLARHAAAAGYFADKELMAIPTGNLDAPVEEIEAIAGRVRMSWRVAPGPIADVVGLLENHGVVVIRLPLASANVDAFSLPFDDHPVVVLGADKNDRARSRFDAAHELAHLVIHGEQIWGLKQVETQAHQFAAALLMPADQIRDQLPTGVDWSRLFDLKRQWQVSLAALLMRARTLRVMSESTYLAAIKASSARGWRRVEPVPLGSPEQPSNLLAFLASDASTVARMHLPAHVVADLERAAVAA
jgi:Zn-dependent peptidase ImmA (M78 family)/DNA-binding XRE family transcriptional regulator